MAERVIVVGAGIAGLFAALALKARGFAPLVLEQDAAPPDTMTPLSSPEWHRRGAPQARHPHFFMGRLRELLLQRQPALAVAMKQAGVWEWAFADMVGEAARPGFREQADDARLTCLVALRTTFELVLRRHVRDVGIDVRSGVRARRLALDTTGERPIVRGVVVADVDGDRLLAADVVVDASGRRSTLVDELRAAGAMIAEEQHDSGIAYFTRIYQLHEGAAPPAPTGSLGVEFPDFVLGALPADHGRFTVTVSVWRDDPVLGGQTLKDTRAFERLCRAVPPIADWIEPARASPVSDVYAFAAMDCFWRRLVANGRAQVHGYFCVGDTAVRTNPKYGRGCTWGGEQAHMLADTLADIADPEARLLRFEAALDERFRHDWEVTLQLDATARRSFECAVLGARASLTERLTETFANDALKRAVLLDSQVQRALMTGYHGITAMDAWIRSPEIWLRILRAWAVAWRHRAFLRRQSTRPDRAAFARSI